MALTLAAYEALSPREQDALVDQVVFGRDFVPTICERVRWVRIPKRGHAQGPPWKRYYVTPYTSDPAAAWEVVEKMGDTWFHLARFAVEGPQWRAQFGVDTGDAWGDTMPEAVCLAALRARGAVE